MKLRLIVLVLIFCVNWSKQSYIPQHCTGMVVFNDDKSKEVLDVKIGIDNGENKKICVFLRPSKSEKEPALIQYLFDITDVNEIVCNQDEPFINITTDAINKRYVNIEITNRQGNKIDVIIPIQQQLICRLKDTGGVMKASFDQIKKLTIDSCAIKEDTEEIKPVNKELVNTMQNFANSLTQSSDEQVKKEAEKFLKEIKKL